MDKPSETKKLTPEQVKIASNWEKILDMVLKSRLGPLQQFWEREGQSLGGVNAITPDWMAERPLTILQVASSSGQDEIVHWLLEEVKADPTVKVPKIPASGKDLDSDLVDKEIVVSSNQTAYDLASTKEVRNVFRRCAGAHPEWWDWFGQGHIPATLTQEMEEKRDEKKRQRKGLLRDKIKERIAQEKQVQFEAPEPIQPVAKSEGPISGPRKLGGRSSAQDVVAGLAPEMRMRIERERRARAAEARLKGGS